eukprot:SAG22_NODE_67_length_22882_cov_25.671553_1_plen_70_part_10
MTFALREELDGNKRTDSWMTLWSYHPKSGLPVARGEVRVGLEYRPEWKKKGRRGEIDAGNGHPYKSPKEF